MNFKLQIPLRRRTTRPATVPYHVAAVAGRAFLVSPSPGLFFRRIVVDLCPVMGNWGVTTSANGAALKLTLTYRGELPPTQRGVSPVKKKLRDALSGQIQAQVGPRLDAKGRVALSTTVAGHVFISPAHPAFRTAVELDVLLLTPSSARLPGDVDNRMKTLVDA